MKGTKKKRVSKMIMLGKQIKKREEDEPIKRPETSRKTRKNIWVKKTSWRIILRELEPPDNKVKQTLHCEESQSQVINDESGLLELQRLRK
jgi:hypothetical protein